MNSLRVGYTAHFAGEGLWTWAIWLEGVPEDLQRIVSVVYTLPSSMRNPVRTSTDRISGFRIEGEAWAEFTVYVVADEPGSTGHQFEQKVELLYPAETVETKRSLAAGERIAAQGAKRMLSLDGGGARMMISLAILERIEILLQQRHGDPDMVLADYFDLVSGTSTGSVLAAGIALGLSVARLRQLILEALPRLFTRSNLLQRYRSLYSAAEVTDLLKHFVGEATLGSPELRTGLMVALLNATTDSEWIVTNAPDAESNNTRKPDSPLHIPLWQLLRGATAAPFYFEPEVIRLGSRDVVVMDAEATSFGCLAFRTFLTAMSKQMGFGWKASASDLLLVSVGTGFAARMYTQEELTSRNLVTAIPGIVSTLIQSAKFEQDRLCRIFGRCLFAPELPEATRPLVSAHPVDEPLFSYLRYDHSLDQSALDDMGLREIKAEQIWQSDNIERATELERVGRAIAGTQVQANHFEGF